MEGGRNIKAACIEQDGTWRAIPHNTKQSMICEIVGMCTFAIKLSVLQLNFVNFHTAS